MSIHRGWKFLSQGPGNLEESKLTVTVTYWSILRSGGAMSGGTARHYCLLPYRHSQRED